MSHRVDFEIRREERGFFVYARPKSWTDRGDVRELGGGLAQAIPFLSVKAAKAWVAEQFSVPVSSWRWRSRGRYVAGRGDPLPATKARAARRARKPR